MREALMQTYARSPLAFERGEGPWLFTTEGRRYLDFAAGVAVNALGHAHPRLVAALTQQAERLWHVSNLYRQPEGERLAARLAEASGLDRVFFCNSGAEAVEGALKVARRYHHQRGEPQRARIITFTGAFHGRTLTTLSAAGNPKYLEGFGPPSQGFDQVPFGNLNALRAAIGGETAAVLVEPVQGEGGVRAADPAFLQGLRAACDEYGLLLILDEVQSGMGRTGALFDHQLAGIRPDVMALAKGLGGGFPLGAVLASEAAAAGMAPGSHGSTFGGNPLAMAVGNAVLDVLLAPGFLEGVRQVAKQLHDGLERLVARHPALLAGVRGRGLLLGLECKVPSAQLSARLADAGLLTVGAAENVVRLVPPLIIESAHAEEALAILAKVLESWNEGEAT